MNSPPKAGCSYLLHMPVRQLNILSLAITAALLIAVLLWPALLAYSQWFFLVVLLLVGIPHGAVDHLIDWKKANVSGKVKLRFFTQYLGLIGLFGLIWFLTPKYAFIGFLLLSAYHFGQSQLYYLPLGGWFKYVVFTSWGMLLLSIITVFNYTECLNIFASLEFTSVTDWLNIPLLIRLIAVSFIITVAGFLIARKSLPLRAVMTETLCFLILVTSAILTNAVFTFTLYFGIWHSFRSMILEFRSIQSITPTLGAFVKSLLPFSLLAIAGMLLFYYLLAGYFPQISPYMVFIVLISALTLPHLIIMDEVYEKAGH